MLTTAVTILRGADTIGGSCIKVKYGEDSIVLDYGAPIMDSFGESIDTYDVSNPTLENGILLDIQGLDSKPPLAYLLSHAHPDHYGLLSTLSEEAKVFLSDSSYSMMKISNLFYPESLQFHKLEACHQFTAGRAFSIGPFTITAFLMDHSAFGACSFLIEVAGKTLFYTGDFRGHGRKSKANEFIYKYVSQPDLMLIEGTTLDGGHFQQFPTEKSVEASMAKLFSSNSNPSFVAAAGGNIDRIVSLYNATKKTGKKLVIDLYQLYLLEELKRHSPGLPPHKDDHLRVIFPSSQLSTIKKHFGEDFLRYSDRHINVHKLQGTDYVFRLSTYAMQPYLNHYKEQGISPNFVYSMWKGYQNKQPMFGEMAEAYNQPWQYMHTSGHAYLEFLQEFADHIAPKKLVPIHTLNGDKFETLFKNVEKVDNGEVIYL